MTVGTAAPARRRARLLRGVSIVVLAVAAVLGVPGGTGGAPAHADEPVATPGDRVFQLAGLGYGHGRGLSQHGAYGAATQGVPASAILDFYYPGTAEGPASTSTIRVLVTDDHVDTRVRAEPGLAVRDTASNRSVALPGNLGATEWRAVRSGGGLAVEYTVDGRSWLPWAGLGPGPLAGPVSFAGPEFVRLVRPTDTRGYRGAVTAVVAGSQLDTVNVLAVDDYLRGVVPREMPSSWPAAALQAQAVAARSYAVHQAEAALSTRRAWDICDTTSCQVYGGARLYSGGTTTNLEAASTDAAIAATASRVRTYQGRAVFAQFGSANGGWTAAGGQPYLVAREDPWDGITGSPAHSWTTTVSATTLEGRYPAVGRLHSLQVTGRDGHGPWGGRVTSVLLTGSAGSVTVTGPTFRSVTGIRSTWFAVVVAADTLAGRYAADPALRQQLGAPVGPEGMTAGVVWQQYERAVMYWTAATGAHVVSGQIWGVYMDAGGPAVLGAPTTDELATPDGVGRFNHFARDASIYWTPSTGAQLVKGQIRASWSRTGWETGPLGYPTAGERAGHGGRYSTFEDGTIFWTPAGGAVAVHGEIARRWDQLGGLDWAVPTGSTQRVGSGWSSTFAGDRTMYWSSATGARVVQGQIRNRWTAAGGPSGVLGFPVGDEQAGPGGSRYSLFQDGGVYWTAAEGPRVVQGSIHRRWVALGGVSGSGFGVPLTDELTAPDRIGRYNHFATFASIYWSPATGARAVQGQIRDRWAALGWERSPLGYPTADERATTDGRGRYSTFQNGAVYWTPAGGPQAVYGAIHQRWLALGGVTSPLGYPTSSEYGVPGGRAGDFEHGRVTWTAATGAVTVTYR